MAFLFYVVDLIIPVTMIIFGLIFLYKPPKEINSLYGYRTKNSMKTIDTWNFAHLKCGKLFLIIGSILAVLILISKLFIPLPKEILSFIHSFLGVISLIITIPLVEKALKNYFDEMGTPK